ncbi:tRNA threonylcarbamoyladenosine dehydratase [Bacteroidales bacterium OttesenSCG-928-M11]|nr:tRNA threonylcarbamoyladenosine dehydratase [Bacteroidales bacterium OttesenSCG-928-M11]
MLERLQRVELLIGTERLKMLSQKRVIVFGVGGVGSWCAESLIRSGIKYLTIVDFDRVAESNINRQLPANTQTIGQLKVDVLKKHFEAINPQAIVTTMDNYYSAETSEIFHLENYDYIIDAIDSVKDKAHLLYTASKTQAKIYSSMGAALKMDPTKIKTAEFWKVQGDPLARALRHYFKQNEKPLRKFQCVYSEERLKNQIEHKANGTLMHITASFGLILASLVIKDIVS